MLTEKQILTLKAVVNRIIPADEDVSGWDGGVGDYIFRQFERDFKDLIVPYQSWLDALEQESQTRSSMAFTELDASVQDQLLANIEKGNVQSQWQDAARFFAVLVEHCAEGFYSNPENGGNRDTVAWQMIGFEVRG